MKNSYFTYQRDVLVNDGFHCSVFSRSSSPEVLPKSAADWGGTGQSPAATDQATGGDQSIAEDHTDAPQCPVLPPRGPAAGERVLMAPLCSDCSLCHASVCAVALQVIAKHCSVPM